MTCLLDFPSHVGQSVEFWLWTRSASRPDHLINDPETDFVAVKAVGDRNVLNITVPELAMHFKRRAAAGHLFSRFHLALTLTLFCNTKHRRCYCLPVRHDGLFICL